MTKKLLIISFIAMFAGVLPTMAETSNAIEVVDNDFQNVTISVSGSTLRVAGASGQELHIYNVAGVRVMSFKVDGADKRYELNLPKGCYIIKVGKTVRKISIR